MIRTLAWCALAVAWAATGAPLALAAHGAPVTVRAVQAQRVKRLLDDRQPLVLVDIRPQERFREARLPGARSVPITQLRRRYAEIPRTVPVVLYCACPPEEMMAAYRFLIGEGYENVSVLEDGFPGWVKREYPLER